MRASLSGCVASSSLGFSTEGGSRGDASRAFTFGGGGMPSLSCSLASGASFVGSVRPPTFGSTWLNSGAVASSLPPSSEASLLPLGTASSLATSSSPMESVTSPLPGGGVRTRVVSFI